MNRPPGFSREEIVEVMGGGIPDDPLQRRAYALLARAKLHQVDAERFAECYLLGDAPDELVDEWQAIAQELARRLCACAEREKAATKQKEIRADKSPALKVIK